jgi:hypothetical protein
MHRRRPRSARARRAGASSGCSERAVQCIATQQERVLATAAAMGCSRAASPAPAGCPFGAQTPVVPRRKPGNPRPRLQVENPLFPATLRTESGLHVLLAMQKVRGFESLQPLPRIRLYRASNSILTAPLDAVLGKGFPADYPLATQTPASGVGSKRLIEGAAEHFLEPLDRHAAISSTCW